MVSDQQESGGQSGHSQQANEEGANGTSKGKGEIR